MDRQRQSGCVRLRSAVLLVGVVLAACGSDNLYAAADLEATIIQSQRSSLEEQDLALGDAQCPDDVVLEEGVDVDCTLDVAGAEARFRATLTDVAAKNVTVTVEPLDIIIPTAAAVEFVEDNLRKAVKGGEVLCGPEGVGAIVAQQGDRIACTVGVGSQSRDVELEVLDETGTVAFVD